ncbi:MAG: hypothetical protein CMM37_00170 [Rhodospirillaceae bacterium]|nr:hypothetical protein [Rhodospirillaceae bacterium]
MARVAEEGGEAALARHAVVAAGQAVLEAVRHLAHAVAVEDAVVDDPHEEQRQPLREEDEEDADVEAAVDGRPVDLVRDHQVPHHLDRGRVEREHGDDVQDFARVDAAPAVDAREALLAHLVVVRLRLVLARVARVRRPQAGPDDLRQPEAVVARAAPAEARPGAQEHHERAPHEEQRDREEEGLPQRVRPLVPRVAVVAQHVVGEEEELLGGERLGAAEHGAPAHLGRVVGVAPRRVGQAHRHVVLRARRRQQRVGRKRAKVGLLGVVGREDGVVPRLRERLDRHLLPRHVGALRGGDQRVVGRAAAAADVNLKVGEVVREAGGVDLVAEDDVKVDAPARGAGVADGLGAARVRRVGVGERDLEAAAAAHVQHLRQPQVDVRRRAAIVGAGRPAAVGVRRHVRRRVREER